MVSANLVDLLGAAPAPAPGIPEALVPTAPLKRVEVRMPEEAPRRVNLVAKWRNQLIELLGLDESLTIADLKVIVEAETAVPPARQKLLGLKTHDKSKLTDATVLGHLLLKLPAHKFVLMGTPDAELLVEPENPASRVFDDMEARPVHLTK